MNAAAPAVRSNRYAANCAACHNRVAEGAGSLKNEGGKWITRHLPGECPAPAVRAPKPAGLYPDLSVLPVSKYMVDGNAGQPVHVEIVERKGGRRYLNVLVGAPGTWANQRVSAATQHALVAKIQNARYSDPISGANLEGPLAAAVRFSREHKCCAACLSPLSDVKQPGYKVGLGPICYKRFI